MATKNKMFLENAHALDAGSLTVHNVTLRGFTFTGIIQSSGAMAGLSFLFSQPGSVTVEDCHWKDVTTVATLIAVGQNDYQASAAGGFVNTPSRSSSLTLRNCHFDTIVYDFPLIYSHDQIVAVENCTFRDIRVSVLPELSCNNWKRGGLCKCHDLLVRCCLFHIQLLFSECGDTWTGTCYF